MRTGVVIWPDPGTSEVVNELRARYDAHYRLIGPHITIAFPGEVEISQAEVQARVAQAASKIPPFSATFNQWLGITSLAETYPEETRQFIQRYTNAVNAILLLADDGAAEMLELRGLLHQAIPQPGFLLSYPPFMTLGQTLSDVDYVQALAELSDYQPAYQFEVTGLDLLLENTDGTWTVLGTYPLG
jgi:2'-5' RNA ligase